MSRMLEEVVVVDSIRTPFGRAGEKGIFWKTRAEDLAVAVFKALLERNPSLDLSTIDDSIWGVTNQVREQGGTLGRMVPILAYGEKGWGIPGCSIDRMCASSLTAVGFGAAMIASGMAECIIAGGVEHMGHLPMGFMRDLHPRAAEALGDETALVMGQTAENIHDRFPEFTREMADMYAFMSQQKAAKAIRAGKMRDMMVPVEVELPDGTKALIREDQTPRPDTTLEKLASLKPAFRENGRVTAGNACPLTDGAAAVLIMSESRARKLGLTPKMRFVTCAVAGVDPRIMGTAPVPATQKALAKAGLKMDDIDVIEINEAFAVQVLYCLDRLGLTADDPRVNMWGGAIAYGHPLAASGARLIAFLQRIFEEHPEYRYGITTLCVGRGQGYTVIWENLLR
ncbi:thiolase family protein [Thermodesulforhabdus norvegica]|uniref:Acetyl-CoA acyltransferase n=1 Tax=Thermodesulforhabdus norvegica TaxID=39841 RepID=A0A1I4W9M9_9BACT|nr:thiolase family protein [Thermodesulforhabdus norvegica]SFN10063.1 acetyl-CoA acyltransferase [Thermodesulforhabdus norvegica]